jgi:peptidyl-prolyl cis-trans isomerase SurA
VEVDKIVNRIMTQNRISLEQMNKVLSDAGSSMDAFRTQLTAQLAWQKAVQDEFAGDIDISPSDINAEMARVAEGAHKTHYLVGEIFLPVDNPEQDAKVQKDAQNLYTQLQTGAPFSGVARNFSQSPTAAQGGDIGWVYEGQLAADLNTALAKLKKGDISQPVRSTGGYYILQLQDRQEPLGTQIEQVPTAAANPTGDLRLGRLLLPLAGATEADLETAKKIAAQVRATYGGCEKLAELPKQLPGAVYFDMGDTKLSDLSPEIRKSLEATKPGEMAAPMMDEAGIELIGRCDAKVEVRTAFTMPTMEEVRGQLFDQQISALARRYMRDIKRDANVEVR